MILEFVLGITDTLWNVTKHFRHLARSHLLLLHVHAIIYKVIRWSHCEFKRGLLYFLNICNNVIL